MQKIRIALTGGGTGGHIYPLIAVARQLREQAAVLGRKLDMRYFGPINSFSSYLAHEGIPISHISSSKYRSYAILRTLFDIPIFLWSFFQALYKVFWFMPDVIFSKGGPGALPVLIVCRFYHIPIVIHESDAVPSRTNRIAARWAHTIATGFPGAVGEFKKITSSDTSYVGNPISDSFLKVIDVADARRSFGLDTVKKTLLFLGGSQGSTRINDFVYTNLETLLETYYMIHQVGNNNYGEYIARFETKDLRLKNYCVTAYLEDNLAAAYAAADLVIGRAGAGMVSEVAALGKPSILIPYPEAAQDHQRRNAYEYASTGAAYVVEEDNLLPDLFLSEVSKILNDSRIYETMAAAARSFHQPGAAGKLAIDILSLIR